MAARNLVSVDFEVFGRVQGVFFRKRSLRPCKRVKVIPNPNGKAKLYAIGSNIQCTHEQAKKLGLTGWCMNTDAGTVAGVMEGEQKQVEEMKRWLQLTGSPQSKIEKATFKNEKNVDVSAFKDFTIRR